TPYTTLFRSANGDYRTRDLLAEPALRQVLHFRQHQRGDLLQREDLFAHLHCGFSARPGDDLVAETAEQIGDHRGLELAPDQALRPMHGVPRVDQELTPRRVSDHELAL